MAGNFKENQDIGMPRVFSNRKSIFAMANKVKSYIDSSGDYNAQRYFTFSVKESESFNEDSAGFMEAWFENWYCRLQFPSYHGLFFK